MKIICPSCKQSFVLNDEKESSPPGALKQVCSACHILCEITLHVELLEKGSERGVVVTPLSQKILVAVDGEASRELIQEILINNHYSVLETADGESALAIVKQCRPVIAVLDVGLPKMFGFEVCETIKKNEDLKNTHIILLAATENKEIYRRKPKNLHGAQDYIETHRLEKELLPKIKHLLNLSQNQTIDHIENLQKPEKAQRQTSGFFEDLTLKKMVAGKQLVSAIQENAKNVVETPKQEEARRLARIIISDIALYNADQLKEALEKNSFHEIFTKDIEEGRKLIEERIPLESRGQTDFIQEAMDDFIQRQH